MDKNFAVGAARGRQDTVPARGGRRFAALGVHFHPKNRRNRPGVSGEESSDLPKPGSAPASTARC